MDQKPNQAEIRRIEEQLSKLLPLGNDQLVEEILSQKPKNRIPDAVFSDPIASVPGNLHHASCFSMVLPVLTGLGGTVLGAVIMFVIFTFAVSPKVEIREIVRYVPMETAAQEPETQVEQPLQLPEQEKPTPQIEEKRSTDSWFLAMFPRLTPPRQEARKMLDLDEMIERQRTIAQNSSRTRPRQYWIEERKSEIVPANFNPEQYKALLEELCL